VAADPALPRVAELMLELGAVEKKTTGSKGVGLRAIVPPLEAYVFYKKQPIVGTILGALLIGIPLYTAFRLGQKTR
jgi:hypothetical protein